MKSLTTLLMSLALATSVIAGPAGYSNAKNPKAPMLPPPTPAPSCNCFGAGSSFDVFAGGIFESGGDSAFGGGVGYNVFFNRNLGIDLNYGLYGTSSEHHEFDANLVLRAPIDSLCLAPYALVGGGYAVNSSNRANFDVGGGLDLRLQSCLGVFAEGLYHFAQEGADYTTVRLGVRIPF
jgi:Outer membrane protein beta-barrel domain